MSHYLPVFTWPAQIQLHHLYSMIHFGIFDCLWKLQFTNFWHTGNFYFLFVALDPFLTVVNSFIIEWRDTELRSTENA